MEQIPLANRLDEQRVVATRPTGSRRRRDEQAERRDLARRLDVGRDHGVLDPQLVGEQRQRLLGGDLGDRGSLAAAAQPHPNASPNASPATARVRSIDASSWASETNQASNCDGGG